jgi:predicted enzyme related to lactoylglutathione lyase
MTRPAGAPTWIDLLTSDPERARQFYPDLFGWTAEEASPEFGGYFMFFAGGQPVAGCMPNRPDSGVADCWTVYLATDNAKALTERAQAHGGVLREGPIDIAELGTEAVLTDAAGTRIGAWQAAQFAGFAEPTAGQPAEPGLPAYFELLTRDYPGALRFYADVFGWEGKVMGDTSEFRLTALTDGEQTLAGIMDASAFLEADQAAQWVFYIQVADTDAALADLTRLGGAVVDPATDTPFGRLAVVTDPTGALFKLIG